jgi:dipeptidyl aminopeptidase/acylaminoacyl peptidase
VRIDRRTALLAGAAAALLPTPGRASEKPEPPPIGEDYALARARFRTRLVKRGPAPDRGDPLSPPPGARRMSYRSGDLELAAWLSEDAGAAAAKRRPAVLFLHGGNALWHGHWDLTAPYREAGYVAMMPSFRAENGQAGFFSGFYDEAGDALAAAAMLRALPAVDPDRVFVAGHSVGGTLTLLAALAAPVFRAAAAFSPNPDARAFFRRFPEDVRFDAADPREFEMRSAAAYATSFKCSVLMLHGAEETRTERVIRLTAARAAAKGLAVGHGTVPGDHASALPAEIAESLRFFARA